MSKLKPPHDPVEALGEAYELLLERALGEREEDEGRPAPARLRESLERERERAVQGGELSREQADTVYESLAKDLRAAGEFMARTGSELRAWLGFETDVLEARLLELFRRGADRTTEELMELEVEAEAASRYEAGELAGPGTLICEACGERIRLSRPGQVPSCPKCGETLFRRESR